MKKGLDKEITKLVAKILNISVKYVDVNADLFKDLGADSLKAIEIVAAIEKKYRIQVSPKKMVRIKTIAQILQIF